MDPTLQFTKIKLFSDRYLEDRKRVEGIVLPEAYSSPQVNLIEKVKIGEDSLSLPPLFCDENQYEKMKKRKEIYSIEGAKKLRDQLNPFGKLGRSIFMDRAAVKLANIDAVYNLTGNFGGSIYLQRDILQGQFSFVDIAAGPGAFTQYIQWRIPNATGIGMTLRKAGKRVKNKDGTTRYELDWNTDLLDMNKFIPYYGDLDTGDLYTSSRDLIQFVRANMYDGVHLVTGDGGFDVDMNRDFNRQEVVSSRLLLLQIAVGLGTVRTGGSFVCKVFDTVTIISAQLLYICSMCFDSIQIIKPVSSRPSNAERYLVCLGAKPGRETYSNILLNINDKMGVKPGILINLFQNELPKDFVNWLTNSNNLSIERQINMATLTAMALKDGLEGLDLHLYDNYKAFTVWNIPDNRITKSDFIK
jgi:cap1 methyltransferase